MGSYILRSLELEVRTEVTGKGKVQFVKQVER
jgi:hypothetical protein